MQARFFGIVLLALAACQGALCASLQAQGPDELSTRDRIYSEEQAQEGRDLFETECSLCHAPTEFSGRIFQTSWSSRPLGAFFSQIRGYMPLDNPGSLTPEQYAAVVAYVLELNGYPTGEEALPHDPEVLSEIRFVPAPDDGPQGGR